MALRLIIFDGDDAVRHARSHAISALHIYLLSSVGKQTNGLPDYFDTL